MAKPPRADVLFPQISREPADLTFELGLVLGGTVSAGAYTAGAIDLLLQSLEAWHGQANPPHRVVIQTAAGASGGAVDASILGLLSSRVVKHVSTDPGEGSVGNPLWDLWVDQFQISKLLDTADINNTVNADAGTGADINPVQHVLSLLNCQMIDNSGKILADFGTTPSQSLLYFSAPFRVAVTFANLRGIPYKILDIPQIAQYTGCAYVQHDDYAWFAFPNGASPVPTDTNVGKREDEFWLGAVGASGFVDYTTLATFATASAAMPLVLAARRLERPTEHYFYRPLVRPRIDPATGQLHVDWPQPDWTGLPDAAGGTYSCTAVDGGTFNNDPVSLVHRALAGLVGTNPRGKSDARRAIFMIDPLADQPKPIASTGKSALAVAESIVGAAVGGARYLTADMELFASDDVYSRFQLVPFRPEKDNNNNDDGRVGEAALAGTSLSAAAGWCARPFRVHDFLLGRWNMKVYLQKELMLAGDNKLFDGWTGPQREDWARDTAGDRVPSGALADKGSYFLPVIPVLPDVDSSALQAPHWPNGAFDPTDLSGPLNARLKAVVKQLVTDNAGGGILPWLVDVLALPGIAGLITDRVIAGLTKELGAAKLWPPAAPGADT